MIIGVVLVASTLVMGLGVGLWLTRPPQPDPAWQGADDIQATAASGTRLTHGAVTPPNYRYSVVPGGVHSTVEVRQAILRDRVVAMHYAGFDPGKFRVETLPARMEAHVSYRVGHEVFWTRKTLVINAGEQVLTDGKNMIRARCGNRIAVQALGPVAPEAADEPAPREFEQLSDPVFKAALSSADSDAPQLVSGPPPVSVVSSATYLSRTAPQFPGSGPRPLVGSNPDPDPTPDPGPTPDPDPTPDPGLKTDPGPNPDSGPTPDPRPTPDPSPPANPEPPRSPDPVPEPSTLVLIGLGAAGGYLARRRQRSREPKP